MNVQAGLFILLLGFMYGSVTVASRFCLGQFDPITYSALRLLMASLLYLFIYLISPRKRQWPKDELLWKRGLIVGVLGDGLPILLTVSGMRYLSSGMTSTLYTLFPVIIAVLAPYFLPDEKLGRKKIIGVAIACCGALLLTGMGETGLSDPNHEAWIGYLMVGGGILIGALVTIYARKFMTGYDTFQAASIRMFGSVAFSLPLAFLLEGFDLSAVNSTGYVVTVFSALIMFFGFLAGFYMIKEFGAMISSMPTYVTPVVASVGGLLILDEQITRIMIFGMLLILIGVAFINSRDKGEVVGSQIG